MPLRAVPPKLRLRPRSTAAPLGADRDLQCDIYSVPASTNRWLKNGVEVVADDYVQVIDGQHLRILGLGGGDEGVYQCVGTNEVGSMSASAQIIVQPGGELLTIRIFSNHRKVNEFF